MSFSDLTGKGNNCRAKWYDAEHLNIPTDYDFSFMAIGDTQIVTRDYPAKLANIYDYVLENVETKNIKHVFGLGDITDYDNDKQWQAATA